MSAVLEKKPAARAKPLGTQIDGIWKLREDKRTLEAQVKEVEAKISAAEETLMETMDREGLDKSTGKCASVSISESISASIEDWDEFTKYVGKTKQFHLLQRRVSDVAARELFEKKGAVPGLAPFKKRKINLRSLNSQS